MQELTNLSILQAENEDLHNQIDTLRKELTIAWRELRNTLGPCLRKDCGRHFQHTGECTGD